MDIEFFQEAHELCGSKVCQVKNQDNSPDEDDLLGLPPTTPDETIYEANCIAPVIPTTYAKRSVNTGALEISSGWEVCLKVPDAEELTTHSNIQLPHDDDGVWRDVIRLTPDHPYYHLIIS